MEEKERYKFGQRTLFYSGEELTTFDGFNLDDFMQIICKLLNQQDKRIKELEKTNKVLSNELTKNSKLKQDHIETCCGIPIFEIPKMKEENQRLKQQLEEAENYIEEDEVSKREYYQKVDKNDRFKDKKIKELKQSQNEKAIKVLEMMIEEIRSLNMPNKPELYNNDMFATGFESHYLGVERIINNQIKSLKGEKNE